MQVCIVCRIDPRLRSKVIGSGADVVPLSVLEVMIRDKAPDGCYYIMPEHNIVEVLGAIQIVPDDVPCETAATQAGSQAAAAATEMRPAGSAPCTASAAAPPPAEAPAPPSPAARRATGRSRRIRCGLRAR